MVIPVTTRDAVTLVLNEYLHHLKSALDAQAQLVGSLPSRGWAATTNNVGGRFGSDTTDSSQLDDSSDRVTAWPEADNWKAAVSAATECQVKIHSELRYVKREFAWSKLAAGDFVSISKLLRSILVPVAGLDSVIQACDRVEKMGGWPSTKMSAKQQQPPSQSYTSAHSGEEGDEEQEDDDERQDWSWLLGQLHEPFQRLWQAMIEGLDYTFFKLGITRKPAFCTKEELEAKGNFDPGDGGGDKTGFATYLARTIDDFLREREQPLKEWCRLNGLDGEAASTLGRNVSRQMPQRATSQLYLILDVSFFFVLSELD